MDVRPRSESRDFRGSALIPIGVPLSSSLIPRCLAIIVPAAAVCVLGGCSLFVMAGKMVFGDPVQTAAFTKVTRVDLTEGEKKVLVVATTPASVKQEMPGADLVVTEQVSRLLRTEGVSIYPSEEVLDWVDDRGGYLGTPQEIAAAFPKADYLIKIDIDHLTHHAANSPDLLRGKAVGNISAYEIVPIDGGATASPVFSESFKSTYPRLYPEPSHQVSDRTFKKKFLDRVCRQIAQSFYSYHARDAVL